MKRFILGILGLTLLAHPGETRAAADFPSGILEPRPITASADHDDYWPCFSPDGTRVFFSRRPVGKSWRLLQAPVAGGEAVPLLVPSPTPSTTRASRSREGRLAFVGGGGIWTTGPEQRHPVRVMIEGMPGNPSYPSWYPDGKQLLVVSYRGKSGGSLFRVDLESGKSSAVTDPSKVRAGMPSVSPDGNRIVFAGQANDGTDYDQDRNSIWILNGNQEPRPLIGHQGRAPSWSPDGKWIAYESRHGSPDQRQAIFITTPDGRTDQRITTYEINANHPVWSPDGRSLAVSIATPGHAGRTCVAIVRLSRDE